MLIRKSNDWPEEYGSEYIFDDSSANSKDGFQLEFSRGDIVGSEENKYYFRVAKDGNWKLFEGVMLDDEQMLELFAAYLKCKGEYDDGKA